MSLNTDKMVVALRDAGVSLNLNPLWDADETYNYIIHQFDITFLSIGWQFQSETARICYLQRKYRGQVWK